MRGMDLTTCKGRTSPWLTAEAVWMELQLFHPLPFSDATLCSQIFPIYLHLCWWHERFCLPSKILNTSSAWIKSACFFLCSGMGCRTVLRSLRWRKMSFRHTTFFYYHFPFREAWEWASRPWVRNSLRPFFTSQKCVSTCFLLNYLTYWKRRLCR